MHQHIDHKLVKPYFQPIICVDKGDIFAYEILGRLYADNEIRSLGPFFHNPAISSVDKVIVDRVVRFKALELLKQEQRNEVLFINIQPQWLQPFINVPELLPTLDKMNQMELAGNQVVIEICEDEFADDQEVLLDLVQRYRQAGCKIAIDDFGTGFSSLDRIVSLKPDYIKVGANLITSDARFGFGQYMMESLGILCEKTGTSLILEEVETIEQFLMGLETGVRFFQGYLFARPSPDFQESEVSYSLIDQGMQSFINRKTEQQLNILEVSNKLDAFVRQRFSALGIQPHMENIRECITELTAVAPEYWLRMYVCNGGGYQVTPNYTRNHQASWLQEQQYLGRNWCWRPYFLRRVVEARYQGRGVLSQPYMDLETRINLWTFVYPLTQDLFLFIDLNLNIVPPVSHCDIL
ncbi:MAG: EAL domain-containing protein [Syntrophomonadaceae bacterium]|nr:EAL domain-containing protein [Syntrophomonadaceae bacterium]